MVGKGSVNHNRRKFKAENVNGERTHLNNDYCNESIKKVYTRASVHGVKGETFDALLLLVEGTTGSTLTPSFLAKGDTSKELMRIAYVAMTRPRKLLVVAMPKSSADLNKRFPKEKWEYIEL